MIPGLTFVGVPTAHLQAILSHPAVAAVYKADVARELRSRPDVYTSKRHSGVQQQVSVTQPEPKTLLVILRPEPPAANVIKRWLYGPRTSKHNYASYRDALVRALASWRLLLGAGLTGKVQVEHRWRTVQARDEDSFGWSLKPVLDAMVTAGLMEDDTGHLVFAGQESGGQGASIERGLTLICKEQGS